VPDRTRELLVGPAPDRPRTASGEILQVPAGWALLPPGDAGLTRRVKAAGPTWTIREPKGRKMFSRGLWAPKENIEAERARLEEERADPRYAQKLEGDRRRRDAKQSAYVEAFFAAVYTFLDFAPRHRELAALVAKAITDHAVPVGSGTVARTERIPIERRAEAATIAWLRHQTTAYDSMSIPRIRGMRREVRRMLADQSRKVLQRYRSGDVVDAGSCVLSRAIARGARGSD
jgi:hypothetical protein